MRARLIEELTIFTDHPPDVLLAQNQNMVQTFTPDCSNEPFAERVRFGGMWLQRYRSALGSGCRSEGVQNA
jgi:hypothetical protein